MSIALGSVIAGFNCISANLNYFKVRQILFFSHAHATLLPPMSVGWSVGPSVRQSVGL